jgi:hypothetical protein
MMNFMNNKKQIIGILAAWLVFGITANAANALTVQTEPTVTFLSSNPTSSPVANLKVMPATDKVALNLSMGKIAYFKATNLTLKKYENVHSLTNKQLKELLAAVGFKGRGLKSAWAIAKRESSGQPYRFNGNAKTGDSSYGLFQINMIGSLGPIRRDTFNLKTNAELFNPVTNAKIAFFMSKSGTDWSAWKGLTPRAKALMASYPKK